MNCGRQLRHSKRTAKIALLSVILVFSIRDATAAQDKPPSLRDILGHAIGEDYFLANYTQLVSYWQHLASTESLSMRCASAVTLESWGGRPVCLAEPQEGERD